MNRPTIRRGVLVLAVALLLAVAGCNGVSDGTTPTANATANATATPTDAPTNATSANDSSTNATSANDSSTNATEPPASGAELDGAELTAATRAAVESAGSYTVQSLRLEGNAQLRRVSQSLVRTNLTADRGRRVTFQQVTSQRGTNQATTVVYTENGTSYRQRNSSRGTTYDTDSDGYDGRGDIRPVNVTTFSQNLTFATDGIVWEANGTTTVDGVNTTRYSLVEVTDSETTITNSSGTLLVDDDNVVRRLSLRTTATDGQRTDTFAVQFAFTEFGTTTVETPPWLSRARQSSSSP